MLAADLMQERCRNLRKSRGHDRDETIRYRYPRGDTLALADLLHGMFKYEPNDRLTIEQVCRHSWLDDRAQYQIMYDNLSYGVLRSLRSRLVLAYVIGLFAIFTIVFQNRTHSNRGLSSIGVCPLEEAQQLAGKVFVMQCASPTFSLSQ